MTGQKQICFHSFQTSEMEDWGSDEDDVLLAAMNDADYLNSETIKAERPASSGTLD